jgi:hypothetical protein
MTAHCRCSAPQDCTHPDYYVVMEDFRSAGMEARVAPEIDRAEVINRLKTRNYKDVVFIHHIHDGRVDDVTLQLIGEARNLVLPPDRAERQAAAFDHARDYAKHGETV